MPDPRFDPTPKVVNVVMKRELTDAEAGHLYRLWQAVQLMREAG
jgi:hypothetical protein